MHGILSSRMKLHHIFLLYPNENFEQIHKSWIRKAPKTSFLPFSAVYSAHTDQKFMKLHNMPRSHMRPSAEFFPFHDDAAWWKKFNFLLRWFFVFARLLALLSFFIYSSLALAKTKTRKSIFFSSCFADGLDDWYWIPFINFSLWKFMWSANWMGCVFLQMNWWFKGEWWRKKKEISKKRTFLCFDSLRFEETY